MADYLILIMNLYPEYYGPVFNASEWPFATYLSILDLSASTKAGLNP